MRNNSTTPSSIPAIILAAGTSSRMGAHKLLLPLGSRPIVACTVEAARSTAATPLIVVLGRDADQVSSALPQQDITTVFNTDFASGMAASLRIGLATVPPSSIGAIVLLADQPLVTPALINAILAYAADHPKAIIAPTFTGQRGHPVYFPRHLFDELLTIQGDEGGRSVIARHQDALHLIEWPDANAALDVDTEEQYARLQAAWQAQSNYA